MYEAITNENYNDVPWMTLVSCESSKICIHVFKEGNVYADGLVMLVARQNITIQTIYSSREVFNLYVKIIVFEFEPLQ